MTVSARVQALDEEILATAEALGTTDRRKIAAELGRSPARVQQAFARDRAAKDAGYRGGAPRAAKDAGYRGGAPRAPGGGRRRDPVLEVAARVTVAAWKAAQAYELPSALRRALGPLRGRDGWQDDLAAAVKAASQPAELALPPDTEEASTIDDLRALLRSAKAKLAGDRLGSTAEQLRWIEAASRIAERIEKLRPAAEVANAIEPAQIPEAAHSGQAKLRHVVVRRRRERERLVQRMLEQAKEHGPDRYRATVWTLRELGELPREGEHEEP